MGFKLEATCGCDMGKIRRNNEDNFYFSGEWLPKDNVGLQTIAQYRGPLPFGSHWAVFDGMGGENYGEVASFAATYALQERISKRKISLLGGKRYLKKLINSLNDAVVKAQKELCTDRMGTTMVMLYFTCRQVYLCNVGDSRAYLLRDRKLVQISQDHVEHRHGVKKTPLTQHLGIDPEYLLIEPCIVRKKLKQDDQLLLCSDGLTDMLTDLEICDIMNQNADAASCVERLVAAALEHGGRDNITAILCKIY